MLMSFARRLWGPLLGAAVTGLVFVSAGQANHLGSLLLGHVSTANEGTVLSGNTPGAPELSVTNSSGNGTGIRVQSEGGRGLYGRHASASGADPGVQGETNSAAPGAFGVLGLVLPTTAGANSAGVRGINAGVGSNGVGVWGTQNGSGIGVFGQTPFGIGIWGRHTDIGGTAPGVKGDTNSIVANAVGILGQVNSSSPGTGSAAVRGMNKGSFSSNGYGVWGSHDGFGPGVFGSSRGPGVIGLSTNTTSTECRRGQGTRQLGICRGLLDRRARRQQRARGRGRRRREDERVGHRRLRLQHERLRPLRVEPAG
jgi:hypothetical protein